MNVITVLVVVALLSLVKCQVPLGCNINGLSDYSNSQPFVDIVKASRVWGSPDAPWDGAFNHSNPADVDANGWPLRDFATALLVDAQPHIIGGEYAISYRGIQNLTIRCLLCPATLTPIVCSGGVCKLNMTVQPTAQLYLSFTNTQGGIKEFSMVKTMYDPSIIFEPNFLEAIRPFGGSPMRFMDWGKTNDNQVVTWDQRPKLTDSIWTLNGIPYEIMIELGNRLNRDIWVNVPTMVDDQYVRELATLIKAKLKSGLNVYVEWSNEVWNWSFFQSKYNLNMAIADVANNPNSPLDWDNSGNDGYKAYRRVAYRAMNISNIFADVWGASAINTRVRVVFAGQIVNPITIELGLEMINKFYGSPSKYFYAIAGAPYFGPGPAMEYDNVTIDQLVDGFNHSAYDMPREGQYEYNFFLARTYGLKFIAYEGGTDTFGRKNDLEKMQATNDTRMAGIITKFLNDWYSYEFEQFSWFICDATFWHRMATFGLLLDNTQRNTVKWLTVSQYANNAKPAITAGLAASKTVDARMFHKRQPAMLNSTYLERPYTGAGNLSYIINAPYAAQYNFSLNYANATADTYPFKVRVAETGTSATENIIGFATANSEFKFTTPVVISLKKGLNLVTLELPRWFASYQYLSFVPLTPPPTDGPTSAPTSAPSTSSPSSSTRSPSSSTSQSSTSNSPSSTTPPNESGASGVFAGLLVVFLAFYALLL